MKLDCFLLIALLPLGLARPSHAQVLLFDNLSELGALPFSGTTSLRLASDFLTDGASWTITGLTASMANSTSDDLHVSFSIFTNGSDRPGTLVGLFETPVTVPAGSPGGLFTAMSSGITLEANTPYWVIAQQNELSSGGLSWRSTTSENTSGGGFSTVPGTPILISLNEGETYVPASAGNPVYSLSGAAIPEPQTWLALLVTLGSFGTLRWWTNRKQD